MIMSSRSRFSGMHHMHFILPAIIILFILGSWRAIKSVTSLEYSLSSSTSTSKGPVYELVRTYTGANFLMDFDFHLNSQSSPTDSHGRVTKTAVDVKGNRFIVRANTLSEGSSSVVFQSRYTWPHGLFVISLNHVPQGKDVFASIFFTGDANRRGELGFVTNLTHCSSEAENDNLKEQIQWHGRDLCANSLNGLSGCSTYILVFELRSSMDIFNFWIFPVALAPLDLLNEQPNPNSWHEQPIRVGLKFVDHHQASEKSFFQVMDRNWNETGDQSQIGTSFNLEHFRIGFLINTDDSESVSSIKSDAYWEINYIKVYCLTKPYVNEKEEGHTAKDFKPDTSNTILSGCTSEAVSKDEVIFKDEPAEQSAHTPGALTLSKMLFQSVESSLENPCKVRTIELLQPTSVQKAHQAVEDLQQKVKNIITGLSIADILRNTDKISAINIYDGNMSNINLDLLGLKKLINLKDIKTKKLDIPGFPHGIDSIDLTHILPLNISPELLKSSRDSAPMVSITDDENSSFFVKDVQDALHLLSKSSPRRNLCVKNIILSAKNKKDILTENEEHDNIKATGVNYSTNEISKRRLLDSSTQEESSLPVIQHLEVETHPGILPSSMTSFPSEHISYNTNSSAVANESITDEKTEVSLSMKSQPGTSQPTRVIDEFYEFRNSEPISVKEDLYNSVMLDNSSIVGGQHGLYIPQFGSFPSTYFPNIPVHQNFNPSNFGNYMAAAVASPIQFPNSNIISPGSHLPSQLPVVSGAFPATAATLSSTQMAGPITRLALSTIDSHLAEGGQLGKALMRSAEAQLQVHRSVEADVLSKAKNIRNRASQIIAPGGMTPQPSFSLTKPESHILHNSLAALPYTNHAISSLSMSPPIADSVSLNSVSPLQGAATTSSLNGPFGPFVSTSRSYIAPSSDVTDGLRYIHPEVPRMYIPFAYH